jgi:hypothetical protein
MARGYLPPEMYSEIAEFLLGSKEYRVARTIQRWWRSHKVAFENEDECSKSTFVRLMMKNYNDEELFQYPTFAKNKVAMYCTTHLGELPTFHKRSEVQKWIVDSMDMENLYLVGY